MKLDRETEALLFWVSLSTTNPLWRMSHEKARAEYRRSISKTELPLIEVGSTRDFEVAGPESPIPIREYVASNPSGAGILFFHGGGGVLGNIDTHDNLCRALCIDTGAAVYSVDYRLAPEHPFPAAVYDGVAALEWLTVAARDLSIDPARIAVSGDSAGGSLAAVALHETQGPARCTCGCPALNLSSAGLARETAVAQRACRSVPDPRGHALLVLQPLLWECLADCGPARDSGTVRGRFRSAANAYHHGGFRSVSR